VNRSPGTQTFGLSFEGSDQPPQNKQDTYHHENRLPLPPPHCPEKNHPSSPPAGLPQSGPRPKAAAQITFTVDTFTTDLLTITLQPGTLDTSNGADESFNLYLVDANGTNAPWVNSFVNTSSAGGSFGSIEFDSSRAVDDAEGNYIDFRWGENLANDVNFVSGSSYSFAGAGLFSPSNVATWALHWGDPIRGQATFQSSGSAVTGGGSAVPEPSSYALILGIGIMGMTLTRRRRLYSS